MYYEDIIKWNKYNLSNNVIRILLVTYKNTKNDILTETRTLKFLDNVPYFIKKGKEQDLWIVGLSDNNYQSITLTEYGLELGQTFMKYLSEKGE